MKKLFLLILFISISLSAETIKLGGRVLAVSDLVMTETDLKPIAMKIKSAKPNVIYFPL